MVLHAFQMLCPGCVAHGIPQVQRVAEIFKSAPLTVIGLHTVFEHHEAMGLESLRVFLHESRVRFPVGVAVAQATADWPAFRRASSSSRRTQIVSQTTTLKILD